MEQKTPLQQAIGKFKQLQKNSQTLEDCLYLNAVIAVLQPLLHTEREFMERVFDAGQDFQKRSTPPDFTQFYSQFQPKQDGAEQ